MRPVRPALWLADARKGERGSEREEGEEGRGRRKRVRERERVRVKMRVRKCKQYAMQFDVMRSSMTCRKAMRSTKGRGGGGGLIVFYLLGVVHNSVSSSLSLSLSLSLHH